MLDFLKEIVEGIPDPSAGGTIDLDSENAENAKKKRGKGKKGVPARETAEPGGGAPRKKRKKGEAPEQPEAEPETEEKSEPEGDAVMDDADEYDETHAIGIGEHSGPSSKSRSDEPGEVQWRGANEHAPYVPRR